PQADSVIYAADMQFAHAAWERDNLERMLLLLNKHRPKNPTAAFEWRYLWRLAHPDGRSWQAMPVAKDAAGNKLGGGPPPGLRLVLSPDGRRLGTLTPEDTLTLWDVATGKAVDKLPPLPSPVLGLRLPQQTAQAEFLTVNPKGPPFDLKHLEAVKGGKAQASLGPMLAQLQMVVQDGKEWKVRPAPVTARDIPESCTML